MPAELMALLVKWDARYPGFYRETTIDIGCGDWDGMQEGLDIPAYSFERALEVSCERLEEVILQTEHTQARKAAPWHVRWGITKLNSQISDEGQRDLLQYRDEVQRILQQSTATFSGAQFSYQMKC